MRHYHPPPPSSPPVNKPVKRYQLNRLLRSCPLIRGSAFAEHPASIISEMDELGVFAVTWISDQNYVDLT